MNQLTRWFGRLSSQMLVVGLGMTLSSSPPVAQTLLPIQELQLNKRCLECNLSNQDLRGIDLAGADLTGANLRNANLKGSDLSGAIFTGADLYLANLQGSNLSQSNLSGANLRGAKSAGAMFDNAIFEQTQATYANFSDASFAEATIQQSNFKDADLSRARFDNASIESSQFNYAKLDQANFQSASVQDSSFAEASTDGTTLPANQQNLLEESPRQPSQSDDASPTNDAETQSANPGNSDTPIETPLTTQFFQQPSAETLPPGTVVGRVGSRFYSLSNTAAGSDDTAFYPTFQISAGLAKDVEFSASYQQADSSSPGVQGPFLVNRGGEDPGNDEATIAAKYRFWKKSDQTLQVSVLGALSFGNRQATFTGNGLPIRRENDGIVPMFQVPVTAKVGDRTRLTLAPTVSFFADSNALFTFRPPINNPGSFGTTFGVAGAASHEIIPRLSLFGDAFAPVTGNNSISRNSGRPRKEIAFNAGLRFLVNPRLGLDVFATNTQGTLGPIALTTQPGDLGLGANLVFLPNVVAGNRKIADSFGNEPFGPDSPLTVDGIGFFDGGTFPKNKFGFHLQGGSQGIMTALRYGILKDLEGSVFLNYVLGNTDESEQGVGAKIRLLNQDKGAPFTASIQGTLSQTNEPFLNFTNNDASAFANSGLSKNVPVVLNRDSSPRGRLFIGTVSVPLHYKVDERAAVWLTPMLGYVQREGLEAAGLNAGGALAVVKDVSLLAEVGAEFIGKGNSFNGGRLRDRIPWTVAVRWDPSSALGRDNSSSLANPNLELYVTNRVGSSVWQQMRVREGGDPAVGVGLFIPF